MRVKRVIIANFLLAILFFTAYSCESIFDELFEFFVGYDTKIILSPDIVSQAPIAVQSPTIQTDIANEFINNGAKIEDVNTIALTQLTLNLVSPANGNFEFLSSVELILSADGVKQRIVATNDSIYAGIGKTLVMNTRGGDLKDFMTKEAVSMIIQISANDTVDIVQDHVIEIVSAFNVTSKVVAE